MFLIVFIKNLVIILTVVLLFISSAVEKSIVYKPSKQMNRLTLDAQVKQFTKNDGQKMSYLHIKGDDKMPTILFCHGNEGNVTWRKLQNKLKFLDEKGFEVYVPDYRGYGKSEGSPDEEGIYADVRAFVDYFDIDPAEIILWGHSLGAAVAVDIAKDLNFKGVILEGAFTSIEGMRDFRIEYDDKGNPVVNCIRDCVYNALQISQKFDSKSKITKITSPTLIIHGKKDSVVPYEMGVELFKLKPDAQLFLSETGTHNGIGWQEEAVLEFIRKL